MIPPKLHFKREFSQCPNQGGNDELAAKDRDGYRDRSDSAHHLRSGQHRRRHPALLPLELAHARHLRSDDDHILAGVGTQLPQFDPVQELVVELQIE